MKGWFTSAKMSLSILDLTRSRTAKEENGGSEVRSQGSDGHGPTKDHEKPTKDPPTPALCYGSQTRTRAQRLADGRAQALGRCGCV